MSQRGQGSKQTKTIDSFFKRKNVEENRESNAPSASNFDTSILNQQPPNKSPRVEPKEADSNSLVRDPGLRLPIWQHSVNQQDEVRRAYIKFGPYQPHLAEYPFSGSEKHRRRFQYSWFALFSSWLEYSPTKDAAFCLPCYLFYNKPTRRCGSHAFTVEGFRNWKKVNDGKNCAFLNHVGEDPCSPHNVAVRSCEDLMNQSRHIDKVMHTQSSEQILKNRLRLKTSIDSVRWLVFQACAFRGHDEGPSSMNRGNFLEMVKILATYNQKVFETVLENAPKNAKYTSPKIQKDILHILSNKVRTKIREDIGDAKFCILVDEARDESKREQMALVLRFVDEAGCIKERFFDIVGVKDTTAATLKQELSIVLSRWNLNVQNLRGQGYDGASNMRGEWNGLQRHFLDECPYAYYVHCFAHRLQLALVAASREVFLIHQFFSKLSFIVNIVVGSSKRHTELQSAQETEIAHLIAIDELETGSGANQIGTLQRAGDTRWGSHYSSVCSLIRMFGPTCSVLQNISKDGSNYAQRGDADSAFTSITSFEFVFILHVMKEIMGVTDTLCQALQQKAQDILNAMHLVSTTKALIQKLREDGWEALLETVKLFCKKNHIDVPDLSACYIIGRGRSTYQRNNITIEHHYQYDIFNAAIDSQLQELNCRFNKKATKLLTLSSALDPKDAYKSFNIDDISDLAKEYYPKDFTNQERLLLKNQLQHYKLDVASHPNLCNISTLAELCKGLAETKKSKVYYLIDRLIRLVLTLPVSTATTERAFSAMKLVKTRLRNKMEDEILADCLVPYIEREIAETFSSDSIIDDFYSLKHRKVQL